MNTLSIETNEMKNQNDSRSIKLLSDRETEVLYFISYGYTNPEIAKKMFLSKGTIATYRNNILTKLSARNSAEIVRIAVEQKILVLDKTYKVILNKKNSV